MTTAGKKTTKERKRNPVGTAILGNKKEWFPIAAASGHASNDSPPMINPNRLDLMRQDSPDRKTRDDVMVNKTSVVVEMTGSAGFRPGPTAANVEMAKNAPETYKNQPTSLYFKVATLRFSKETASIPNHSKAASQILITSNASASAGRLCSQITKKRTRETKRATL